MKKIGEVYRLGMAPSYEPDDAVYTHDIGVGIEIEAEAFTRRAEETYIKDAQKQGLWLVKGDGSLRNGGVEFTSSVLFGKQVRSALEQIESTLNLCDVNWRCAVHAHLDVRNMEWSQIKSIAELYCILEPLLFAWEGNDRHESRFCLPWYTTMHAVFTAAECVRIGMKDDSARASDEVRKQLGGFGKYTALNLMPIIKQGSIEFRHMQTTKDINRILEYINLCLCLVKRGYELEGQSPLSLLSGFGAQDFLIQVLGGPWASLVNIHNHGELLWKGIDTANILTLKENPPEDPPDSSLDTLPILV